MFSFCWSSKLGAQQCNALELVGHLWRLQRHKFNHHHHGEKLDLLPLYLCCQKASPKWSQRSWRCLVVLSMLVWPGSTIAAKYGPNSLIGTQICRKDLDLLLEEYHNARVLLEESFDAVDSICVGDTDDKALALRDTWSLVTRPIPNILKTELYKSLAVSQRRRWLIVSLFLLHIQHQSISINFSLELETRYVDLV